MTTTMYYRAVILILSRQFAVKLNGYCKVNY